jgi:hypothetical protein
VLADRLGRNPAEDVRIIYGGSVNDGNCNELATQVMACVCVYLCVCGGGGVLRCVRWHCFCVGGWMCGPGENVRFIYVGFVND